MASGEMPPKLSIDKTTTIAHFFIGYSWPLTRTGQFKKKRLFSSSS